MSGDGQSDVTIPIVFLFFKEGQRLLEAAYEYPELQVLLTYTPKNNGNLDLSFNDYRMHSACCGLIDILGSILMNVSYHTGSRIPYRIVVNSSRKLIQIAVMCLLLFPV